LPDHLLSPTQRKPNKRNCWATDRFQQPNFTSECSEEEIIRRLEKWDEPKRLVAQEDME
jgi:hypothetical protein